MPAKEPRKNPRGVKPKHGHNTRRFGPTPTYRSWYHMVERCTRPTCHDWKYYGGRGITICERWLKFENFLADMGAKPDAGLTIGRIDNSKGYEPGNCRWETRLQQGGNTRRVRTLTVQGVTGSVQALALHFGVKRSTVSHRMNHLKWPEERCFAPPRAMRKRTTGR